MAKWIWPCPGNNTITSGVGPRWGTEHKGIDISAPRGENIVASRGGVVTKIYTTCTHNYGKQSNCGCSTYGNHVFIDHQDGYTTRYAHMTSVNVKVGDRVAQGELLGTVGSTGYSTGNHLHFEIRNDSNYLDPEDYVNSSNTIENNTPSNIPQGSNVSNSSATNESTDSNYSLSDLYATTGSVIPIMTRDFIEGKPYHAFLKIYIGDDVELAYDDINRKPGIIQSFEITRLEDAGGTASFVLFDDQWDAIEPYLSKNWDNITIIYGYSAGFGKEAVVTNERLVSPKYKMLLQNYSIDFTDEGTILTIEAMSEGIYENMKTLTFYTATKNPVLAIRRIATKMNWKIDESDYEKIKGKIPDVDMEENYTLRGDNPMTYIQQEIIPEAKTEDGEILAFYLDYDDEGNTVGHLRLLSYGDIENEDSLPIYVYQKGYDSVIEDLSVNIKGVFGGTTMFETVTTLNSGIIDSDKNEKSGEATQSSVLTAATGKWAPLKSNQSDGWITASGESKNQMDNRLYYHVKNGANQAYEATMTILGDPRIELLQAIKLIIPTDYGSIHHTSGVYLVKGITDSIENGDYKTTLQLIKNADMDEGVELRENYSRLVGGGR